MLRVTDLEHCHYQHMDAVLNGKSLENISLIFGSLALDLFDLQQLLGHGVHGLV